MITAKKWIYLDVCTLCRPLDDQSNLRVRMETNAVYMIFSAIREGHLSLVISPAHWAEIARFQHELEDEQVVSFIHSHGQDWRWDLKMTRKRAEELYTLGFGPGDAAHLAFAEVSAEVFVTCDNQLLRRSRTVKTKIRTMRPSEFAIEEGLI